MRKPNPRPALNCSTTRRVYFGCRWLAASEAERSVMRCYIAGFFNPEGWQRVVTWVLVLLVFINLV